MKVIYCKPELTMTEIEDATEFYKESTGILRAYVANVQYISTPFQINQLLAVNGKYFPSIFGN